MDKPKVYFMDARSESPDTSLINKTVTVFEAAGFDKMINKGDVVAIKMHCGELGSSAYIRPAYVRAIADKIKQLGGRLLRAIQLLKHMELGAQELLN